MIKTTIWKPDTCDCEVEYEWDTNTNESERSHTIKNILKTCSVHTLIITPKSHFEALLEENRRKNSVLKDILDNIHSVTENTTGEHGVIGKTLKSSVKYLWSFDSNRNLIINLPGFNTIEKNALKSIANIKYGSKVIIN